MKYLLYCAFRRQGEDVGAAPVTVNGALIRFVEADGLCVAVSEIDGVDVSARVSEAIAYHRIIESFHRRFTVIPFRFGVILSEKTEIEDVLRKKSRRFGELLQELEGCDEMGIRILSGRSPHPEGTGQAAERPVRASEACSGKDYLEAQASRYFAESSQERGNAERAARFRSAFEGMFTKFKADSSEPGLLSLYFLVPGDALVRFRETFSKLSAQEADKMMLSGPWPPYNFVLPEDSMG